MSGEQRIEWGAISDVRQTSISMSAYEAISVPITAHELRVEWMFPTQGKED
jgi:hypothetical protein